MGKHAQSGEFQAIVLAAGQGRRMRSELPKVLIPVLGRPMVSYVLEVLAQAGIDRPIVVVGRGADQVRAALGERYQYARQAEQLGSGHAVLCAREVAIGQSRHVVVMCGDSPLFRAQTIRALMDAHIRDSATVTLAHAILENPRGYGRIIRDCDDRIIGVVEEVNAGEDERAIREINGGCYAFDAGWLWANIGLMTPNEAGELCLTQMVDIAIAQGRTVISVPAEPDEVLGVNTPEDLAIAESILAGRKGETSGPGRLPPEGAQ